MGATPYPECIGGDALRSLIGLRMSVGGAGKCEAGSATPIAARI
jgi:hypothetical protein